MKLAIDVYYDSSRAKAVGVIFDECGSGNKRIRNVYSQYVWRFQNTQIAKVA